MVRVLPGVYRDARAATDPVSVQDRQLEAIAASAWKLHPDDVISHFSAATLWGLCSTSTSTVVHWTVSTPGRRAPKGIKIHYTPLAQMHRTRLNGLLVTSLERTAVDCMRELSPPWGLALVDSAMRLGLNRDEAHRIVSESPNRRGRKKVRALLELATSAADSPPESVVRLCAINAGVGEVVAQYRVNSRGTYYLIDVAIPELRLALEYDGRDKYSSPNDLYQEKLREDFLRSNGWTVIRFTAQDLGNLPSVVLRIENAARQRGSRPAAMVPPELRF